MAPKARPIDLQLVQTLLDQGHTQRQIAEQLQLPESTLRHRLKQTGRPKVHQGPLGGSTTQGPPEVNPGEPIGGIPEVSLGIPMQKLGGPEVDLGILEKGTPEVSQGLPQGNIPTYEPDRAVSDYPEVYASPPRSTLGIPGETKRPFDSGPPKGDLGRPETRFSPQLADELCAAWPELQDLLAWWRARHQGAQAPREKLERVTYHVAPRWIEAVKREADRSGESYAAVVNRAFALYFNQRETSR